MSAGRRRPFSRAPADAARDRGDRRAGARRRRASAATCTSATAPAASTTPTRRSVPQPTPTSLPKRPPDRFSWPIYGYTKDHSRFFPAPDSVRPPFRQLWVRNAHELLEFPPVIYAGRLFQLGDNAVLAATNKHTGARRLEAQTRPALGLLAGRRPRTPSTSPCSTAATAPRAASSRSTRKTARRAGAARCPRAPSPRRSSTTAASSSAPKTAPSTRWTRAHGNVLWTYHAGGAVKASPTLSRRRPLLRRLLRARAGDLRANGRRIWRSGSEGALLGSGTFYSTCRRLLRARLPRQHRRARLRLRRLQRASSTGPCRRAPTSTPRPPSPTPPASARRSTSAPTTAPSTRSTPAPGTSAGRFDAGGRISGSADDHRPHRLLRRPRRPPHLRPRHLHRPQALPEGHRRLRPRDQRRQKHLPDRLHGPLRADAALAAAARTAQPWQEEPEPSARASEKRAATRSARRPRAAPR